MKQHTSNWGAVRRSWLLRRLVTPRRISIDQSFQSFTPVCSLWLIRGAGTFSHSLGHSLPVQSAPVSHHVGNGLKADVPGKWWNGKILARSRSGQSDAWRARRFGSILSRAVGGVFVLDQIDIGQDAAARYRPALGKERDHAAAKVFMYFYGASLIAQEHRRAV
jgi:hypothetical protein